MRVQLAVLAAAAMVTAVSAQGGFRIVVIEGEDAVNIIQQKTAVRPIVEVRDRNDLPVSGVLVTFSIEGGKAATFGGASTLTVATNAAGQAAVSGLTPSVAGAFQIQVSAVAQGQVVTATIAQTNVLTAAQAAAASASAASGGSASSAGSGAGGGAGGGTGGASGAAGGAAGGGGLSATTLVVAGAAVAGGAVVATQIADKVGGKTEFRGSFSGTITGAFTGGGNCTYSRSVTATARLTFEELSDSVVRGEFGFSGSQAVIASTCPMPGTADIGGKVDLTGSPARFSGRNVFTGPANNPGGSPGEVINGSQTHTFEGSINGSTATGTLRIEENSVSVGGPGGRIEQLGVGTFTITFQKS